MRTYPLFSILFLLSFSVYAQDSCGDGYSKIYPETTTDFSLAFGHSISIHQNFMAVGVPNSDTLKRESGLVYLYEKIDDTWKRIASMVSSEAIPDLQLGISVKLTENYLFASASAAGGSVYVYKKPATGWVTSTETTILAIENTTAFGVAYYHPVDLSDDENKLVIVDALKLHNNPTTIAGSLFVFRKTTGDEWTPTITPLEIKATTNITDFGRTGTYIRDNRIFIGSPFTDSGSGDIFIYHDPSGTFNNLVLEATLKGLSSDYGIWVDNMVVTDAGVFIGGRTSDGFKIYYYEKPANNVWTDMTPTCLLHANSNPQSIVYEFIRLTASSNALFATSRDYSTKTLTKLSIGQTGWCSPTIEILEKSSASSNFGSVVASNDFGDVVVGYVSHPLNAASLSSLKAYSPGPDGGWRHSLLYSTSKSTRGHGFSEGFAVHNQVMFVGAPYDNTLGANKGKVYIYQQADSESPWEEFHTIHEPIATKFGRGVATHGDYLAVSGYVNGPAAVMIYKKDAQGWRHPTRTQVLKIPEQDPNEVTFGETLVMNERWLLIPYVNWRGFSDMYVAVFELIDEQWTYTQSLLSDYSGIFTSTTNGGAAIHGDVIVAANRIYELNPSGVWEYRGSLLPKDPESLQLAYPSMRMLSNGANFGRTVIIKDNVIAIGAPRRDWSSSWDVGAVYVFTKHPQERWSTRNETLKIVPDEKIANGLFGWDIQFAEDQLLIGAPGASTIPNSNLNYSAKNLVPGRVYLYQSRGATPWESAAVIKKYSGELDFRDNFGNHVGYSNNQIIIAASEDDAPTGRTSGAVYIRYAPVMIEPLLPLCVTGSPITLSANRPRGLWSGPGIEDPLAGKFNPSLAGAGNHEIQYYHAFCNQVTTMNVVVDADVKPSIKGPKEILVCATPIEFSRKLSANTLPGESVEWYYRSTDNDDFSSIPNQTNTTLTATQRGHYRLRAFNASCEGFTDFVIITDEQKDLVLEPLGEICGTPLTGISLQALPEGGSWSGSGVRNNTFFIDGILDGTHSLQYTLTSSIGCTYTAETNVTVKRIPTPTIARSGNLCIDGVVTNSVQGGSINGLSYIWEYFPDGGNGFIEVGDGGEYETTQRGFYRVTASKDDCYATSQTIRIVDTFTSPLTPSNNSFELCHDHSILLQFPVTHTSTFEWFYSEDGKTTVSLNETANTLRPDKTGFYTGITRSGICSYSSPPKYFLIHPKDSVFVPNVITPNGDGKNDTFSIITLQHETASENSKGLIHYDLYNRYGSKIFSAPDNQPWNGGDHHVGVYYWHGKYHTCHGEPRTIKGFVHLMK